MERVITSLSMDDEHVTIGYATLPDDLRDNGLAQQHQLLIPVNEDYVDGVESLIGAALELLEDALEDWERLPPFEPVAEDDDETDDDEDEDDAQD